MEMKWFSRVLLGSLVALQALASSGQTYIDSLNGFRKNYIKELLEEKRQPVGKGDERYLRFFDIDPRFRALAEFTPTLGAKPFMVATHSGKQKPFKEYGVLKFSLVDTALVLHVYQSVNLMKVDGPNDDLFIPFNDFTNYFTTYGGGRYIDLKTTDIVNGICIIDFNKCYNPYCAYADGFSCPIPPRENYLHMSIFAGEKMYAKMESY